MLRLVEPAPSYKAALLEAASEMHAIGEWEITPADLAARFGNRSLVNATFEHLKGSLRTLGAAPEPATAALYQQLH